MFAEISQTGIYIDIYKHHLKASHTNANLRQELKGLKRKLLFIYNMQPNARGYSKLWPMKIEDEREENMIPGRIDHRKADKPKKNKKENR